MSAGEERSAATTHGPGIGCTCEWDEVGNPVGGKHKPPCRMAEGSDAANRLGAGETVAQAPDENGRSVCQPRRVISDSPEHLAATGQRFTERGAECRQTHVEGYTGPICSCPPMTCRATKDSSENEQFNSAPTAASSSGGDQRLAGGDRDGSAAPMGKRPARDAASRLRLLRDIAALCRLLGITMSEALNLYEADRG